MGSTDNINIPFSDSDLYAMVCKALKGCDSRTTGDWFQIQDDDMAQSIGIRIIIAEKETDNIRKFKAKRICENCIQAAIGQGITVVKMMQQPNALDLGMLIITKY